MDDLLEDNAATYSTPNESLNISAQILFSHHTNSFLYIYQIVKSMGKMEFLHIHKCGGIKIKDLHQKMVSGTSLQIIPNTIPGGSGDTSGGDTGAAVPSVGAGGLAVDIQVSA